MLGNAKILHWIFSKDIHLKGVRTVTVKGTYSKKVREKGRKAAVLCAAEITTKVIVQMARERAKQKDQ